MDSLERVKQALKDYLGQFQLDQASIDRIICEALPFLTTWELKPAPPHELEKAEAVISFSFGFGPARKGVQYPNEQYHPLLYEPGKSNEVLARIIKPFVRKGKTIFVQWEVAEALKALSISILDSQVARSRSGYLGTSGVVQQFLTNGLNKFSLVILVAHPHHAFRCREITKTICKKNNHPIEILIADTREVPYDPDSVQPWTRSVKNWVEYEIGNRFHNRYQGKM